MTEVLTEEAREGRINEAINAAQEADTKRTEQIDWKDGSTLLLPVVRVPLEATVLNPASHRIRPYLEALGTDADFVKNDPYGIQSQELIGKILRETPGFEQIKGALERDNQRDPGVLTHKGVLVNANTRRVALEQLGRDYIDVVVLPTDATEREITDLELALQMAHDVKQDYTFTARLLFIEELLVRRGISAQDIGLKLDRSLADTARGQQKAREFVEQEMRLLRLIREVVNASGEAIRITKFDDDRQELIEIDEDYERERQRNPVRAVRVRDAQLTGLISDLGYKRMRKVDEDLIDNYLPAALAEQPSLRPYAADLMSADADDPADETSDDIDGLDILESEPNATERTDGPDTTRLFTTLAAVPENGDLSLRDADGTTALLPRQTVVAGLNAAFATAIEAKERETKAVDRLEAPMAHLADAARSIDRARDALDEVGNRNDFDREALDDAADRLTRAYDEFDAARSDP